jgi:outer membrane protein OmpA-like peptidoglycan-associated protein
MQRLVRPILHYLRRFPTVGLVTVAAGMLVISGCTEVPDYANPAEWYRSAVDVFDDDAPPPAPAEDVPGAHEPFPSVGDVPDSPNREIELSELESVGEGLAADRESAKYTDEILRSDDDGDIPLPTVNEPLSSFEQPPSTQFATTQYATLQQPVQSAPGMAPGTNLDVKTLFANLFQSSGPQGVAPAVSGTGSAALSTTVVASADGTLPVTSTMTSGIGSSRAAVIYFASGSSSLNSDGRNALHRVADLHKQRGGVIRVVGHASNRTSEVSAEQHELINFNISYKRARAVADELISHGVAADKVVVISRSDSEPVYHEWMPSGEAGNRRAEVFIDF